MKALLVALPLLLPAVGNADGGLPLDETNFVDAVQYLTKDKIAELLGEPASSFEVKDIHTGELLGYVWNYEYLNTSENGDYYKSTELDLVNDRVATVVFSNPEDTPNGDAIPNDDAIPNSDATMEGSAEGECTPTC